MVVHTEKNAESGVGTELFHSSMAMRGMCLGPEPTCRIVPLRLVSSDAQLAIVSRNLVVSLFSSK